MNELVVKKALIFSIIFGAILALLSLLPFFAGFGFTILAFLCAPSVILFMKKNEKHLAFIDNRQGLILGSLIGFFSSIGFFVVFCPMVCILRLIFKTYYAYAIPDAIQMGLWFLLILIFFVAMFFAMLNGVSGMATTWFLGFFEKKPKNYDAQLDIKIDD